MLAVVEIADIPEGLPFMRYSMEEYAAAPKPARLALVRMSEQVWKVEQDGHTLAVAGIIRSALIGPPPELWLLVCEPLAWRLYANVKEIRRLVGLLTERFPGVTVRVDAEFAAGRKFARILGFKKEVQYEVYKDREYITYEVG